MTRILRTGLLAAAVAATFVAVPTASANECLEGTALPPCNVCYELPLQDRKCVLVGGPIQT